MSAYSADRSYLIHRSPLPTGASPMQWARNRRSNRTTRRLEAAGQRAGQQLEILGAAWHLVDWPHTGVIGPSASAAPQAEGHAGFLAIGPGGVFAVTVVDQGRYRVMIAGDVVQIQGRRPPYVVEARKDARRAGTALTAAVGATVPVTPVLVFVGSGAISVQGLPDNCLVASHRELNRLLTAGGERISAATAGKLSEVASHPDTWADVYRWYSGTRTVGDKRTAGR